MFEFLKKKNKKNDTSKEKIDTEYSKGSKEKSPAKNEPRREQQRIDNVSSTYEDRRDEGPEKSVEIKTPQLEKVKEVEPTVEPTVVRIVSNPVKPTTMAKAREEKDPQQQVRSSEATKVTSKTLNNTTAKGASKQVKDIEFWGDGDTFKLISKASSESEGWMKSTKAMQCGGSVVIQVTTQQRNHDGCYVVAEALTTVPMCNIYETIGGKSYLMRDPKKPAGKVTSREVK